MKEFTLKNENVKVAIDIQVTFNFKIKLQKYIF